MTVPVAVALRRSLVCLALAKALHRAHADYYELDAPSFTALPPGEKHAWVERAHEQILLVGIRRVTPAAEFRERRTRKPSVFKRATR